jgi:cytochrome c heme-lyase
VSSIPRSSPSDTPIPANAESNAAPHASGNWIYPSESQFYNAVLSKNTASSPDALLSSISHIIPIHNAVNERAWTLIRGWEGESSKTCGGPKLHSFSGRGAGALSPKAKWNAWVMGYQEPFDRHDWVVERCGGERVEYVIDFYQGKADENAGRRGRDDGKLNFYLDVRPKLNSWEGWRMRGEKALGMR